MKLVSTLTCPLCGHQSTETMPTDACQFFYECKGCGALLKPKAGGCCVFCSYGDVPCPPLEEAEAGALLRALTPVPATRPLSLATWERA